MARRVRRLALFLVLLLVVGGVVALVVTSRGQLGDDRDRAEDRWGTLRAPLVERYTHLDTVLAQLRAAGAGDLDATRDLARELERWQELQQAPAADADTETEVSTANALEGIAARVTKKVASSPRLGGDPAMTDALAAFAAAAPAAPEVAAYNDAVQAYQDTREELRYSLTAGAFGYEPIPELFLAPA
ncbi:MAG TPA: hypothetical protein VF152_15780 [Acidimicrobiia bacterium]